MDILAQLRARDRACRTAITLDRTHSAGWEIYGQAAAEIERLGRCNEQFSRSHAEVVNAQNAEIKRLREELHDAGDGDTWREACGRCETVIEKLRVERDDARAVARHFYLHSDCGGPRDLEVVSESPWLEGDSGE